MNRLRHHILAVVLAAVTLPAAAAPCAARGTGGFLRQWAVCGPLGGTKLDEPKLPAEFAAYPGLFAAGGVWVPAQAEEEGRLNLKALYPEPPTGTALLHTFFEVPADGAYHVRIGSDDAVRVEVDGRTVHSNDTHRAWEADQDNLRIDLKKGWHRLLVRVLNYGGEWAASVRLADAKDQPVNVNHQATVPAAMERACRLDEAVTVGERAEAAKHLGAGVARLQAELEAAVPRLARMPEGYVTFAEYEGARALGRRFFEAMAAFWREAARDESWDEEAVRLALKEAVESARGFSEVLAQETEKLGRAVARDHKVWETLGGEELSRRQVAAATLQIAQLLTQSRQLAARIENERLLAARFENDIRNWRQKDLVVRVVDAEGGAVAGADVEIVQTGHDFRFGCNLFAFRRWDDEKKNAAYEKRFRDLFNLATVPLYWSVLEKQRGRPDFELTDAAVRWCRDNRIQVRGHPLLWHETVPRWVDDLKGDDARAAARSHVRQTIERYRETVDWWDVVQQSMPAARAVRRPGDSEDAQDAGGGNGDEPRTTATRVGPVTIDPAEALRWALDSKPRGRLLLGGGRPEDLAATAGRLRAGGVRLDGVGVQAHQHEGVWPLDEVRRVLDAAAAAQVPVHVSEVTLLGGPEREAEQAEAVRHFYTAAFAHPKVASITWWDLSDRFAWKNAPAGLVRADLAPKPAYRVLERLLNHLWRTDAAGRTGEDGQVTVRAFFGQYRVTARQGRRKATVDVPFGRDGPAEFEVVLAPAR